MQVFPTSPELDDGLSEARQLLAGIRLVAGMGNRLTLYSFALIKGIRQSLIGAYTTQDEVLASIKTHRPDLLIATENLEQGHGVTLLAETKAINPDTLCLIFVERETMEVVNDCMNAGADGVMFISTLGLPGKGDFLQALRSVVSGHLYYPQEVREVMAHEPALSLPSDLTGRELEVLTHLSTGKTNKEIAEDLFLSAETVKKHVSTIIAKLEVRDRTAAAVLAIKAGLG